MNINLDFNRKEPFFFLNPQKEIGRILTVALPFIGMYSPAAKIVTPLLHVHRIILFVSDTKNAWESGKKEALALVIFDISLVSLSIFFPSTYLFLDLSYGLILHLKGFKEEIKKSDPSKHVLLTFLSDAIYCAVNLALFVKSNQSELLMVSFLIQSLQKSLIAFQEYDKGHCLELVANSTLSLIKLKSFQYYAEISYRNYFGKTLTQKDLDLLLKNLEKNTKQKNHKEEFKPESTRSEEVTKKLPDDFIKIDSLENKQKNLNPLVNEEQESRNTENQNFLSQLLELLERLKERMRNLANILNSPAKKKRLWKKKKLAFSEDLKRLNYKSNLKDLKFNDRSIKGISFKDLTFSNVTFKNVLITKCQFKCVIFDNCKFFEGSLMKCFFYKSNFNDTLFQEVEFYSYFFNCMFKKTDFIKLEQQKLLFHKSFFHKTRFMESDLKRVEFDYTTWEKSLIYKCNLEEVVFFGAKAKKSSIEKSNLKNTLLLDAKEEFSLVDSYHHMSKPVIGLVYDFEFRGDYTQAIETAAKKLNAVVFRISPTLMEDNEEQLTDECFQLFKKNMIPEGKISEFFIKMDSQVKEISKIRTAAEKAAKYCDGIIFPGGENIPKEFYLKNFKFYGLGDGYSRTLTEIYLLNEAKKRKIPCLFICRGVQLLNIYHGGTLKDVKKHFESEHTLKINPELDKKTYGIVKGILQGDSVNAHSMHEQGIDKVGKELIVAMKHEGLPELVISNEEEPLFVGTQFHPEYYQWGDKKKFAQNETFFVNLENRMNFYVNQRVINSS